MELLTVEYRLKLIKDMLSSKERKKNINLSTKYPIFPNLAIFGGGGGL